MLRAGLGLSVMFKMVFPAKPPDTERKVIIVVMGLAAFVSARLTRFPKQPLLAKSLSHKPVSAVL